MAWEGGGGLPGPFPLLKASSFFLFFWCYSSSMIFVHPKGGGSTQDTIVSLINVDMVSGLIKYCQMPPFITVCRDSLQVVTVLFCVVEILHVRIER